MYWPPFPTDIEGLERALQQERERIRIGSWVADEPYHDELRRRLIRARKQQEKKE